MKDALTTLYHKLGGPDWTRKDHWLSGDRHPCEWQGVTCQKGSLDRVTVLELSQNNLYGNLDDPVVLDALLKLAPTLEQLWLSENSLTGTLPVILADETKFPHLTILDVGSNLFSGCLSPAFSKRSTPFSWFETTGNQLTSYYRYMSNQEPDMGDAPLLLLGTCKTVPGLTFVHVMPSLLTKPQCATLVQLAEQHVACNGWDINRHKAYQTTDIDISTTGGELLDICNEHLKASILPVLKRAFEFEMADLAIEDLFLAKYSADKGQQSVLQEHRDDSELSFVITLNDSFVGGGTRFGTQKDGIVVAPETGGGAFFCGRQLHSGAEVTEGTRYILAGFVRVHPSTPNAVSKLDSLLEATT